MSRGKKFSNFAIGAFLFSGLFLLLLFIYFAGKFSFIMGGGYSLLLEYDFLDNLQAGSKVRVSGGPPIGYISGINFDTGKIVVEIKINGKYKINRGAVFNIYSTSLVGQKYINVSGYDPNITESYTNNEYIVGVTPLGFARTIELAGASIKSLMGPGNTDTMAKFKDIFLNTSQLIEGLNHLVNDNSKDIRSSVQRLNYSLLGTGEAMQKINLIVGNLELTSKKLNTTMNAVDENQIAAIVSNVGQATMDLKVLTAELNRLTYDKTSALNLVRDKDFKSRMDNIVKNFEEFSKKIKDNPSTLFFNK
jgi:ABC-type transporter Mla subunit MlaD